MSKSTFKFLICQEYAIWDMRYAIWDGGEGPSEIWFPFYPGTIVPPYRAGAVKIAP